MASAEVQETATLFNELKKAVDEYDDDRSLDICDQLLKLTPEDQDALRCRIVTLIRLEKYSDALAAMEKIRGNDIDLRFERIYCYYRTHQLQLAETLLNDVRKQSNEDSALMYLEAQLLYAQDKYKESIAVYESLLETTDPSNRLYGEIQVNLLAAKAGLLFSQPGRSKTLEASGISGLDLYEVAYNVASVYLGRGELEKASEHLEKARKQCNARLAGSDMSHEEIDEELAIIATQLAYTYQLQGRLDEAMEIYESVLSSSVKDESVNAIVANNIVAIQKARDLNDAAAKLKMATNTAVQAKLKPYQKQVIAMNEALLQLHMSKVDAEALEDVVPGLKRGYVRKDASSGRIQKPKTKKKRKPLLPKEFDPSQTPNPERWLPKRERSTYRVKGKNKKAANKGPQGVAIAGGGIGGTGSANIAGFKNLSPGESEPAKPQTPPSANTAAKSSASKNKKKKKGGKGKW
ncbi:Signal recognition particle core component [Apophysomyces ossiformis]|uniref:Signal recognition particle subunit SRP72 n=1 Tax=Apophysomyces ossiformis TaxID=679940 RepID=A0A8H7BW26_9FUNG|nr:Signal recognition particle core component [Apophysomyces ossiformis]